MTSAAGRGTTVVTSSAAAAASGWRPRSFHAWTSERAAPSYATAARADEKASRRPEHSVQRVTGQAVGAPQRAHSGGRKVVSDARQEAHSRWSPGGDRAADGSAVLEPAAATGLGDGAVSAETRP